MEAQTTVDYMVSISTHSSKSDCLSMTTHIHSHMHTHTYTHLNIGLKCDLSNLASAYVAKPHRNGIAQHFGFSLLLQMKSKV